MSSTKRNWKPVRSHPNIFCSPACGSGCTIEDYRAAVKDGRALAKRLGRGWAAVVKENMGWHYHAEHPQGMAVHAHPGLNGGPTLYWATTVDINPQHHATAKTPRGAVRMVIADCRALAAQVARTLSAIDGV